MASVSKGRAAKGWRKKKTGEGYERIPEGEGAVAGAPDEYHEAPKPQLEPPSSPIETMPAPEAPKIPDTSPHLIYDEQGNVRGTSYKGKEFIGYNKGEVQDILGQQKFQQAQGAPSTAQQAYERSMQEFQGLRTEEAMKKYQEYEKERQSTDFQQMYKYSAAQPTLGAAAAEAFGEYNPLSLIPGVGPKLSRGFKAILNSKNAINDELKEANTKAGKEYSTSTTQLKNYIDDINRGGNSITNMKLYRDKVYQMYSDYADLKRATIENPRLFSEEGFDKLVAYETFFERELVDYDTKMQQALLNPNPNQILNDAYQYQQSEFQE